jgi:glycosyltransferase involved in cell wall biosynthesis
VLRPVRILHVVARMDRGGIETSLMHLLRTVDQRRYQMDVMTLSTQPGAQDDDVRALGSRIIPCPEYRRPWRFARDGARVLQEFGPYDVVHTHTHYSGGIVLRLAARHGVPIRIANSRMDTLQAETSDPLHRRVYVRLMKHWIRRYATLRVAISPAAAVALFGDLDGVEIIPSGRDFRAYSEREDRPVVRAELGLPPEALVVGHVGRFYPVKNHPFILEVAAALFSRQPDARLLLVGDGPELDAIRRLAQRKGLSDRVIFTGARADVPRLLKGTMDAFLFPSHHEGLGMAVVEAQAAGLSCVISDRLPQEIDVVPALIHRLSLDAPPTVWAERILDATRAPRPARLEALRAVRSSDFDIDQTVRRLQQVYDLGL